MENESNVGLKVWLLARKTLPGGAHAAIGYAARILSDTVVEDDSHDEDWHSMCSKGNIEINDDEKFQIALCKDKV